MPSLALAAAVGLFSQQSAATEEIVVYGTNLAQVRQALFRSSQDEYVRSLNEQIRVRLDENLKEVSAPKLLLAESETLTRG
ncbi:MAG: hypothetical protein JXB36_10615 [Gammaproteobacteria bacterium]|nr:hypothetical protein [Gammaproteobacteria bacterium]